MTPKAEYLFRKVYDNKKDIESWLESKHITDYSITSDLIVNVKGSVNMDLAVPTTIKNIPVQFGLIEGHFIMPMATLMDLSGCPHTVEGHFDVFSSQLLSLKGGPQHIGGNCDITANCLKSFEFCPRFIGGSFKAYDNPIKTLQYLPMFVGQDIDMSNTMLKSLDLKRFQSVLYPGTLRISRKDRQAFEGLESLHQPKTDTSDNNLILSKIDIENILLNQNLQNGLTEKSHLIKRIKI